MAYNFLTLCNRVLSALNEVQLTSSTFSTAAGFQSEVQNMINLAILDVLRSEDYQWPFLNANTTFNTIIGTQAYTPTAAAFSVDWDSFSIRKQYIPITSLTQSAGVATAVTALDNQLVSGDQVIIQGASPSGYTGNVGVTVTNSTHFTYSVSSSLSSPATGTITQSPPYYSQALPQIGTDVWKKNWMQRDIDSISTTSYDKPRLVVRQQDNTLLLTPIPDRVYTIYYEYFTNPSALSAYSDVPVIPEVWQQVIVDRAMYRAYLFRDNPQEASMAKEDYKENLLNMRRVLIPQQTFISFE